ncbi:MAG: Na+/H+ antiporter subunit B [Gammaproteobacteria bacterium]|nr:Na+/H+ antiporter subunit B [Gammaproteobacteria bacterium]
MESIILRTATKFLLVLMLLVSLFTLFRGHNEPGGGFVGGLIAASAFSLYLIAYGAEATRRLLPINLRYIISTGMICALVAGLIPMLDGKPFLTGKWMQWFALGTPLLFDIGVYLVVVGAILMVVLSLEEKG